MCKQKENKKLFIRAMCQAKCRQMQAGDVIKTEDTAHEHGDKSLRRTEVKKEIARKERYIRQKRRQELPYRAALLARKRPSFGY